MRARRRTWPSTRPCSSPGDTILSLRLDHGGHLTHGLKVNFSGRLYSIVHYGVSRETMRVDYDEVLALAKQHRPKLIVCGGSAYPRTVEADRFRAIADEVGAYLLCDMAHFSGLVAAGLHPNPVPHCDFVSSTTHKTLVRPALRLRPLPRGARAGARPGRVPGDAGRSDGARDRGEGDLLPDRRHARLPRVPDAGARECRRAGRRAPGGRARRPHRRHRHASAPGRPAGVRVDGQGRGGAAGRGEHHRQPEHRSLRRAAADGRLRRADGHARLHDARLRRGRLPRGRADRGRGPSGRRGRRGALGARASPCANGIRSIPASAAGPTYED